MSKEELDSLRKEVDRINDKLVKLLAERKQLTDQILELKKELNLTAHQPDREQESLKHIRKLAQKLGLELEFAENIMKKVIKETRVSQEKALTNQNKDI
ncbi:MAG: chorismate mutase [Nanoarchaeota archaeon]|nr:chorismate mutase [Nanoarchaeota archaeon]